MKIPIVIVDDNPSLLKSISRNLLVYEEVEILFTATSGVDLLLKINDYPLPKVILMDIEMPSMNGIQATYEIFKRFGEDIKIIILTIFDQDEKIFDAIMAGASGYLMKDEKPLVLMNAINEVLSGGSPMSSLIASKILDILRKKDTTDRINTIQVGPSPADFQLTKRELEILQLIAIGKTYRQIAEQLFVSDKTIKKHNENIYRKLHVNSKYEAMQFAQRYNWVRV